MMAGAGSAPPQGPAPGPPAAGGLPLGAIEKATILQTLEAADGNKSETARRLGITRRTLHKKLKAYGVMK
jgi:two-component system response regulator HydG